MSDFLSSIHCWNAFDEILKIFQQINKPQAELRMLTLILVFGEVEGRGGCCVLFDRHTHYVCSRVGKRREKTVKPHFNGLAFDGAAKCLLAYNRRRYMYVVVERYMLFEFNWKICANIHIFVSIDLTLWNHFSAQANGIPSYLDLYILLAPMRYPNSLAARFLWFLRFSRTQFHEISHIFGFTHKHALRYTARKIYTAAKFRYLAQTFKNRFAISPLASFSSRSIIQTGCSRRFNISIHA